jgi:hypothetical protein
MRFRDALNFSLELFLPERAVLAVEHFGRERPGETSPTSREQSGATIGEASYGNNARKIIEDLDSSQFGGPSFGPQTIALMSRALEEAQASLLQPIAYHCTRAIAASILKVAAAGERDPVRLRTLAMSALKLEAAPPVEAPSAMPSNQI